MCSGWRGGWKKARVPAKIYCHAHRCAMSLLRRLKSAREDKRRVALNKQSAKRLLRAGLEFGAVLCFARASQQEAIARGPALRK